MDIKLPNLGEGADSGIVVSVFVNTGDRVEKDQAILEIENEKAVASIPASAGGVVEAVHVKPGDNVSIGQRLISLGGEEGAGEAQGEESAEVSPPASPEEESPAAPAVEPAPTSENPLPPATGEPPPASPSIRRIAKELGIDLRRVRGSERGGRVVMGDLRNYIARLERLAAKASATGEQARKPQLPPVDFAKWGPITVKPLSQLRQVIGRRMSESWALVPRVTQFDEADITALLELRKEHKDAYQERGARLTLTGFIIKALTATLAQHPIFNSSLDDTEENLVLKSYTNIGIAVDTDQGLLVPVLKEADKKSLIEVSREMEDLAARARERKLALDEMQGSTFTISNQGGIGSGHFTPVVNLPDAAILGVGRGGIKPVWRDGEFVPRHLLPLTLSYDHRIIDGGSAARFMVDLVKSLGEFNPSLVKL